MAKESLSRWEFGADSPRDLARRRWEKRTFDTLRFGPKSLTGNPPQKSHRRNGPWKDWRNLFLLIPPSQTKKKGNFADSRLNLLTVGRRVSQVHRGQRGEVT